jgi:DNA modification methylase
MTQKTGNGWAMYNGDCIEVLRGLPDNSIDFSVYSPPFSSLYSYSNSLHDMGNSKNDDDFFQHYGFLIREHMRTMKPGRLVAVHCMNLPTSKQNDGYIGLRDFRGGIIDAFQKAGFIYHAEVCIWKCPVVAVTRTKALGLLHKQLKKDSAMSRTGIPDYVVVFRKPGDNPDRIEHTNESFPVDEWQKVASPVWMDIKQTKVLKYTHAREDDDTRHICPLQLEVIERCLKLWSRPGDVVMSPFAGIGSEGAVSIAMGRRFIGIELKKAYFDVAVGNLENPLEPAAVVDGISDRALSETEHYDYAQLLRQRADIDTRIKTIDRTR